MGLEANLELTTDDALSSVSTIDDALGNVVQNFKVGLADALGVLQDTQQVDITADTSQVTADIDSAVAGADTTVTPDAVTTGITEEIDSAVSSADATVTPAVNADDVTQGIDDAVQAADPTVTVQADTSQAQDELAGLGDAGSEAGKGLSDAAAGATNASGGINAIGPAAGLAAGEMGQLKGVVGEFGPEAAAAGAATFGLVAAGKELFDAALEQQTAIERLNRTFGDESKAVEQVHIGGLNTDLEHLAILTGSNVDGLRNFAATFGQLGIDSGHAKEQVAGTVDQIIALASRASVLNPNLGSADEIVGRLSTSLARGGRFAGQFGISLTAAEINARALIDTGKQTATELSVYEKAAAGAEIATERLGTRLGKDITTGAQSDAIQVRRLGVELDEAKKKAGAALVEPVTESMTALVPVLTTTIALLGQGLTSALKEVEPELKLVGSAAKLLGSEGGSGGGVSLFGAAVHNLVGQINPLHALSTVSDLVHGHFMQLGHDLPVIGVGFDIFDKGKSKSEQLADQTKKLAAEQNDQAHASLMAAVNAGQLSRETEVAAIKQHTAKDGTVDWVGVLDQLQNTIVTTTSKTDQYSQAVADQASATKNAAQGQQDLAQIQLGSLVATGQLTQAQLDHLSTLNLTKEGTVDYATALKSVSPAAAAVAADSALIADGISTVHTHMQLAADEAKLYKEGFDDLVTPTLNADQAQLKWDQTIETATSDFTQAKTAADAYKTGVEQFVDPVLAAEEGSLKLSDAIDATNKALIDNKGVTDEKTDAGRKDQQAVIDLVKAYDSAIDAQIRSGESADVVQRSRAEEVDQLRVLEQRYPGLKGRVDEYITSLNAANNQTDIANRVTEAHRGALQEVIGAGEKWIETLIATGAPQDQITAARQQEIDKLQALKAKYPELGGVIDGYIAKLQAIPPSKDTVVNLPDIIQREVDLANIHQAIDDLHGKGLPITVDNVTNALNDAGAVKNAVENIPQNWNTNVDINVNGLSTLQTTESLIQDFLAHPTINVNANIVSNIAAGVSALGQGGMAGRDVQPFEIFPVNEQNPGTSELFVSTVPGRIVSKADAIDAIREAASLSQPGSIDPEALARLLDRVIAAQRPFVVNAAPGQDEQAVADSVAARLGYEATR